MDRTASPEPEVTDQLIEEVYSALGGDEPSATEEVTPSTAPASTAPDAPSPSPEPEVPAEAPASTDEPEGEAPSAQAPTPPASQPSFVAPTGDPLAFRLDGRAVTLEGAVQTPDGGVYLSPNAWRQLHSSYLGDRTAWQQKEARYRQDLRQTQQGKSQREHLTNALYQELTGVLEKGPEEVQAWLENFQLERPLLVERARRRAVESQLADRQTVDQERDQQERAQALVPALHGHLNRAFDVYLAQERYRPLAADPQLERALREVFWKVHADSLFGDGEDGAAASFNEERFAALLDHELNRVAKVATVTKQVTAAARHNAAATQPAKPAGRPASPAKPKPKQGAPFDREQYLADQKYDDLL